MPYQSSAARAKAFTLVELLVVIGIIAVLVGILLPVLARARDQANRTVCMSNIRQIAMAFMMYARDNRDWCPYSARHEGGTDQPADWIHWRRGINNQGINSSAVARYLGNRNERLKALFRCPSDRPTNRPAVDPYTGSGNPYQYSYTMNSYFDPRPGYQVPWGTYRGKPTKLGGAKRAAEKILLAEENEKTINNGYWIAGRTSNENAAPTPANWIVQWDWLSIRHDNFQKEVEPAVPTAVSLAALPNKSRKGVVAFADGHVDLIPRGSAHSPEHVLPQY
jgi:prepilin-type N-terminal cleavage/methylation domain-containing protein/prepilin-type processing-associated H-X9-DG protein